MSINSIFSAISGNSNISSGKSESLDKVSQILEKASKKAKKKNPHSQNLGPSNLDCYQEFHFEAAKAYEKGTMGKKFNSKVFKKRDFEEAIEVLLSKPFSKYEDRELVNILDDVGVALSRLNESFVVLAALSNTAVLELNRRVELLESIDEAEEVIQKVVEKSKISKRLNKASDSCLIANQAVDNVFNVMGRFFPKDQRMLLTDIQSGIVRPMSEKKKKNSEGAPEATPLEKPQEEKKLATIDDIAPHAIVKDSSGTLEKKVVVDVVTGKGTYTVILTDELGEGYDKYPCLTLDVRNEKLLIEAISDLLDPKEENSTGAESAPLATKESLETLAATTNTGRNSRGK